MSLGLYVQVCISEFGFVCTGLYQGVWVCMYRSVSVSLGLLFCLDCSIKFVVYKHIFV